MTTPSFVQFVLDVLAAEWDTTNYDPQPTLIDQRDAERQGTGDREVDYDLADNNVIAVGSQPTRTNEPIGTEFDYEYVAGVTVRVEAVHESETYADQPGGVADAGAFSDLVTETKRAIHTRRVNPTSDDAVRDLRITEENDQSPGWADHFRTDLTVEFRGYEILP